MVDSGGCGCIFGTIFASQFGVNRLFVQNKRQQLGQRGVEADRVLVGIALRQVVQPELVVEEQVEQGAVHVEEDGVDLVQSCGGMVAGGSVDGRSHCRSPNALARSRRQPLSGSLPPTSRLLRRATHPKFLAVQFRGSGRTY